MTELNGKESNRALRREKKCRQRYAPTMGALPKGFSPYYWLMRNTKSDVSLKDSKKE